MGSLLNNTFIRKEGLDAHTRGVGRTVIGHRDREGHLIADVRRGVVDKLGHRQVGLRDRRGGGRVVVVRQVGIVLRRRTGRSVGVIARRVDRRNDDQISRSAVGQAADRPGRGRVATLVWRGGNQRVSTRQCVVDADVGGI